MLGERSHNGLKPSDQVTGSRSPPANHRLQATAVQPFQADKFLGEMIDAAYSIRHNLWATRELLEHARSLSPEQLELSVAGTAGGIMFSLAHIVGADQRYLVGLGSVVEVPIRPAADVSLAEIILAHASNEVAWERLLENPPALATWFERADRHDRVRLVMLPAQAIHHGTDHRIQIGTILLHHGLELPDLDVWTYAAQMGDYQRLES